MKQIAQDLLYRLIGQRRSITRQVVLVFALISVLVIAVIGFTLDGMLSHELLQENNVLLLDNLVLIRNRLQRAGDTEALLRSRRFAQETETGYGKLHAAILDEEGHVMQASNGYNLPPSALPKNVLPANAIPDLVDIAGERQLASHLGKLSTEWLGPDGHGYQLLLARVPLAPLGTNTPPGSVLVALSYDRSVPSELLARYRRGLFDTLLLGVLISAALGVWAAHIVLKRAKRVACAARRISAHALHERLALEETPAELLETAEAFNQMLDRLEDSFRRLSDFSSDLAHDLRTPINNLLGEAQVALSRPREAGEYRAVLESAVEEYERLARMIENMLFLARADNAQGIMMPTRVALRAALQKILSYFELLAEERGVKLVLAVTAEGDGEPAIWADDLMLNRAVANLLSNALRYSPAGSEIQVNVVSRADGSVDIEVANSGKSIAAEHLPRVFDRFYRVDGAREDSASNSGLGLAIVKSIMELHGGKALVESRPHGGTAFTLRFPANS